MHHQGSDAELDAYVEKLKKVVQQQVAVFGDHAAVRRAELHLHRRLPPVGLRRRDGAPQLHHHHLLARRSRRAKRRCSARCRTSSSIRGTWSGSGRKTLEPFDFTRANMSGELWFARGVHQLLRTALPAPGRGHLAVGVRARALGEHQCGRERSGPPVRESGRDEPPGAVRGRGHLDRPDERGQHLHLLLHLGIGGRAGARPVAAEGDGEVTRRVHADHVDPVRPVRSALHPAGPAGDAGRVLGQQGIRRPVLREVHRGARGAGPGRAPGAGRSPPPASESRCCVVRAGAARHRLDRRPHRRAHAHRLTVLRGRTRPRRRGAHPRRACR